MSGIFGCLQVRRGREGTGECMCVCVWADILEGDKLRSAKAKQEQASGRQKANRFLTQWVSHCVNNCRVATWEYVSAVVILKCLKSYLRYSHENCRVVWWVSKVCRSLSWQLYSANFNSYAKKNTNCWEIFIGQHTPFMYGNSIVLTYCRNA